jgi:Etoposide-induced protein 2.4 (EI24)
MMPIPSKILAQTKPLQAMLSAIRSQFHPKMLALLFLPWAISAIVWGLVLVLTWVPLTTAIGEFVFSDGKGWLYSLLKSWGLEGAKTFVSVALAGFLFVPLMFATAMLVVTVFAMPAVIRYLAANGYSDVARKGSFAILPSVWNVLGALVIFVPGYILTIPLWFIPVLGLLVPLFWWAWLNSKVMRFDSLVEHASAQERVIISKKYSKQYWLVAFFIGALNYIPPLFLLTPVLSALAFGHFSLNALRLERHQSALPVLSENSK